MMDDLAVLAAKAAPAAQLPTITVSEGGLLGNTTAAGLGILLIYFSRRLAKGNRLLWNPKGPLTKMGQAKNVDILSILSFFLGFLGITMILGSPDNPARTVIEWGQALFVMFAENPIVAMFGAGGFCIALFLLAYAKDTDCPTDIMWGSLCAVIFPLGGGVFSTISLFVAGIASGGLEFSA